MKRNPYFSQLSPSYLFSEIKDRVQRMHEHHPHISLINLSLGNTSEPLGCSTADALCQAATDLKNPSSHTGYGPEGGLLILREAICNTIYHNAVSPDEIFVSDGAKSDISRLQLLIGPMTHVAVQDPSYPAYAESCRLGRSSDPSFFSYLPSPLFSKPLLCTVPDNAVLFLCSPNNPTGEVFTHAELETLISHARRHQQIIVYDTAYQAFIQGDYPRSIYEIHGAEEVAIEIGSFSKMAGFCGLRLGWTAIPHALRYTDGQRINPDFCRLVATVFNGASLLSQQGGIQVLSLEGQKECQRQIDLYRKNTHLLQTALVQKKISVSGGRHAPFLWVKTEHKNSWDAFDFFLEKMGIVVCPGVGFGPLGEGHIRICGFGNPASVAEAASRIDRL